MPTCQKSLPEKSMAPKRFQNKVTSKLTEKRALRFVSPVLCNHDWYNSYCMFYACAHHHLYVRTFRKKVKKIYIYIYIYNSYYIK